MQRGVAEALKQQYREALKLQYAGRSNVVQWVKRDPTLTTLAQLRADAREGVKKIKFMHDNFQQEFQELCDSIPLLVRSIWGSHAQAVLSTMKKRQLNISRLIKDWQDAEHRLIAVANSLTTLQTGQKLVVVGFPLAAAHLLGGHSQAQCYTAPVLLDQKQKRKIIVHTSVTLKALHELVQRIAEEILLLKRGVFLFLLFVPMLAMAPTLLLSDIHRDRWLNLMIWTIERAGPAFIKWGQWAATRPDLFAPDVCAALSKLQTNAPSHTFQHTRKTVESALDQPLERIFASFDENPVASGSIAQVHRATLTKYGSTLALDQKNNANKHISGIIPLQSRRERRAAAEFKDGALVAVKVRHPGVTELMERDFKLMHRAASIAGTLPGVSGPQLKESLMQFGAPMREQLDLREEARALDRFAENFKSWDGVRFPLPAGSPLIAPDVLVESFENGDHISCYLDTEGAHNKRLADLGMKSYLKMLLRDNFIHADLHPGNILVTMDKMSPDSLAGKLSTLLGVNLSLPRLVLLDVGMTARLTSDDQKNLVGFFSSLTEMNGRALAESILKFSEEQAPNPNGFCADMAALFETLEPEYMRENSQQVIGWMMDTIRKHEVHLRGVVSTVVFSSMVLEGWSSKLDPDIRIVETLKDILPSAWKARAQAAVDKVVFNQSTLITLS